MRFAFLFALVALLPLSFCLWTAQINITVADLAGRPVDKAQVSVVYQKASQVSETDGLVSGETNQNGIFTAFLSNRVPEQAASRNIQVRVSTIYWQGETKKLTINESDIRPIRFVVPFRLEEFYVKVVSSKDEPVRGADVVISGKIPIKKQTGLDGRTRFFFPQNFSFAGYVVYMNSSIQFNSSAIKQIENKSTIVVKLPAFEGETIGSVAGSGKMNFSFSLLGLNGSALAERKVLLSFDGKNYTVYTDEDGAALFFYDKEGQLNLTVREYEHDYSFSFNLSNQTNATEIKLYPLLKIVRSGATPQKQVNCFTLFANVSDPRKNLSLRVRMLPQQGGQKASSVLKVNNTSSDFFVSEYCITSDTVIKIVASNKYESAEAFVNLTFVRPQAAGPAKANLTNPFQPAAKEQETDDMVVVAIVLLVSLAAASFFARAYIAQSARFIIEYLRKTRENIEKRRKKPQIPPLVPPPPPPPAS
ncbi:MAG: hypothetical protein N3G80_01565 [Candidatus Micrarchaeota archaeon]|nr:hypothetical protein [Candidatus Micrarchaeota archaeon]